MFADGGNIFTIFKMTSYNFEALSCHDAVIKNEKYSELFVFDDTQKMAQLIRSVSHKES